MLQTAVQIISNSLRPLEICHSSSRPLTPTKASATMTVRGLWAWLPNKCPSLAPFLICGAILSPSTGITLTILAHLYHSSSTTRINNIRKILKMIDLMELIASAAQWLIKTMTNSTMMILNSSDKWPRERVQASTIQMNFLNNLPLTSTMQQIFKLKISSMIKTFRVSCNFWTKTTLVT